MLSTATAYGLQLLVPARDEGVGQCLREHGEFARVELEFILAACDGDLLDVGANVGAICLPFAARRPNSSVVAIEAHRKLAQILAANALINNLGNVDVFGMVAGERSGAVPIPMQPIDREANIGAGSLYDQGFPTELTIMTTLDQVAPNNLRFVKIDVEGFEDRVLAGAKRLLNEIRPKWLVEVSRNRPNTMALVRNELSAAGYRMFWFFSPFVTPSAGGPDLSIRGDAAIFACDGEPPWPMKPVSEAWPVDARDFPFLLQYGFKSTL